MCVTDFVTSDISYGPVVIFNIELLWTSGVNINYYYLLLIILKLGDVNFHLHMRLHSLNIAIIRFLCWHTFAIINTKILMLMLYWPQFYAKFFNIFTYLCCSQLRKLWVHSFLFLMFLSLSILFIYSSSFSF